MDYKTLLQNIDMDLNNSLLQKNLYPFILSKCNTSEQLFKDLMNCKNHLIQCNNFNVSSKSLFFINERSHPTRQLYINTLQPEHQWFYNQIK